MKETIAKADWLNTEKQLSMAWLGLREAPLPPNKADLFRLEEGQAIGTSDALRYRTH